MRVASPADIPQAGARFYEAGMVACCHQHLQQRTVSLVNTCRRALWQTDRDRSNSSMEYAP